MKIIKVIICSILIILLVGCGISKKLDYVTLFKNLGENETLQSMNEKIGFEGVLVNPEINKYSWDIKDGVSITACINSENKVREMELVVPNEDLYNPEIVFTDDLDSLKQITPLTYEDVKEKCGGVDGIPTRRINGKVNTYVWVGDGYKLTIMLDYRGEEVSWIIGIPLYEQYKQKQ